MKNIVINEENYKVITIKRMIVLCWILLLICFVMKLFGASFEFVLNSKIFDNISNNTIIMLLIQFLSYLFSTYMLVSIIYIHKANKNNIFISVILMFTIKTLGAYNIISLVFGYICEFIFLIVLPICKNIKKWYIPIVANIIVMAFQLISLLIKNLGINFDINLLSSYIFMIDYYIMITLYYLYSKEGSL